MDNIAKMQKIEDEIKDYATIIRRVGVGIQEFSLGKGSGFTKHIYTSERVGIAGSFFTKDSYLPKHVHETNEYLIITQGKVDVSQNAIPREKCYKKADIVHVKANVPHSAKFLEDTYLVAITIPPDKDWPNDS